MNAGNATEPASDPESKSAEELAKETQNPVANLISVPFQNNFNFDIGPNDATQGVMNVQPVIPITLNKDWNLIEATIVQGAPGALATTWTLTNTNRLLLRRCLTKRLTND